MRKHMARGCVLPIVLMRAGPLNIVKQARDRGKPAFPIIVMGKLGFNACRDLQRVLSQPPGLAW